MAKLKIIAGLACCLLLSAVIDLGSGGSAGCQTSPGEMTFTSPLRPARVIIFPGGCSLGHMKMSPGGPSVHGPDMQVAARGRVVVPAGYQSFFSAEQVFFAHPEIIKTLPPDGFESIKISATAVDDREEGEVDRALAFVGHLSGLREVILDKSDATDAGVAHIAALPEVQRISVFATAVNGSCLKQLSTMKSLNNLRLSQNTIEESNLKYLAEAHNLSCLSVARCRLHDSALKELARCTNLATIDLTGNPDLSDEGLKYLQPLKKLSFLGVASTKITVRGLMQLKGLPLKTVMMTDVPGNTTGLAALRQVFPGVQVFQKVSVRPVDRDTGAIFAPTH